MTKLIRFGKEPVISNKPFLFYFHKVNKRRLTPSVVRFIMRYNEQEKDSRRARLILKIYTNE